MKETSAMDMKYQTEEDARVLTRAGEIASEPKRMVAARKHMEKQIRAMKMMGNIGKANPGRAMMAAHEKRMGKKKGR